MSNVDPWKYRAIRDTRDDVVKRHSRKSAIKLIETGFYEYADDGPDDLAPPKKEINPRAVITVNRDNSASMHDMNIKSKEMPSDPNVPQQEIDMSTISNEKKSSLRKIQGRTIPAQVSPGGIDTLKNMINAERAKREVR